VEQKSDPQDVATNSNKTSSITVKSTQLCLNKGTDDQLLLKGISMAKYSVLTTKS
jgi:hypothetical protein